LKSELVEVAQKDPLELLLEELLLHQLVGLLLEECLLCSLHRPFSAQTLDHDLGGLLLLLLLQHESLGLQLGLEVQEVDEIQVLVCDSEGLLLLGIFLVN